jgi:phosphatidylglycerophosphate synthase
MVEKQPKVTAKKLVEDYGHIGAHVASLLRVPGAHLVRHYLKNGETKKAFWAYAGVSALDFIDGKLARASTKGGSQIGGRIDDLADKYVAGVVEKTMVEEDLLDNDDFVSRLGRNTAMTVYQRPKYKRRGNDVSAVLAGKFSTLGVIVSNAVSMTEFIQKRPLMRRVIQKTATTGTWYSYFESPRVWEEKTKKKAEGANVTVFEAKAA